MCIAMQDRFDFLFVQYLLLILSFLILWNFFNVGGSIDLKLIYPFIDQNGQFPLRQYWSLAELNHRYVKDILILVYLTLLIGWLISLKLPNWNQRCWEFGYFFCMVVLSTTLIGVLKSQSDHACPWDMIIPTQDGILWDFSSTTGHCFPGGHASSGFALITGYFVYRISNSKQAYFFLITGMILGFAMGWAQMMRGAHFFSHNLWTGWITWLINVISYTLLNHKLPMIKAHSKLL